VSVDLDAILGARARIRDTVIHTPLVSSVTLSSATGGPVVLKAENLQRTGSFKIRGAMNKLAVLGERASAGVTAGSAGNHAQALAAAARHHGVPCEIFVPIGASITKIEACRSFGATVLEVGESLSETMAAAIERAADTGMVFCHPYDDPDVVNGQGTLGLELLDDVERAERAAAGAGTPDVAPLSDRLGLVVVPVGGGGLAAGVAIAVKSMHPEVRVVGVQAGVCAPYAGMAPPPHAVTTLADGIAVKRPGAVTGPLVAEWLDAVIAVDEDAIADAMVLLMERAKLYVEGAGAVGVAALLAGLVHVPTDETTCVVLSGGNVDLGVVPGLIRRHETDAGRRLSVYATVDDRPGGLARLLTLFAEQGANLIEVEHIREGIHLHVRETGVHATFEVRSAAHGRAVVDTVRAAGYPSLRTDPPVD
jgi:threonine dehydratase